MRDISVKQHEAFIGAFAYHYRHVRLVRTTRMSGAAGEIKW